MKTTTFSFLVFFFFLNCFIYAQDQSLNTAERLGYPKDSKLLIIHADDAGVSHSENMATIRGMEEGIVNSASIMVPCPWFPEIANYARENSETKDFGLHLTITSEWKNFKWGSTSSKNEVGSLINPHGYFYSLTDSVRIQGKAIDVEKEIDSQIKKALDFGIDVTHLDGHMMAVMSTPDFMEAYIKKGREYRVPVLLNKQFPAFEILEEKMQFNSKDVITDHLYQAYPEAYNTQGMDKFYVDILNNLEPGLSVILIHLAMDNEEMQAVTKEHPDYGSKWRQDDLDFFTSEKVERLIEENDIVLVTWRELRDKLVRSEK